MASHHPLLNTTSFSSRRHSLPPSPSSPLFTIPRRIPSPPSSSPSFLLSTFAVLAFVLSLASTSSFANAQTVNLYEPPAGQVLFGAWIDTQAGFSDTPTSFNARLGQNVPIYQIAQLIPLPPYDWTTGAGGAAPENLIEKSDTDAAVFLTVYPSLGFDAVADSDYSALASQILDYRTTLNRTVFLRYAPEMQGTWNLYGQQPSAFNTSWHAMYAAIKSVAPDTIMVWAPNTPQGYPYGETFSTTSAADITLLDTNGDGELTSADNALTPYYPGNDVVDWVGLSLYYKGPASSDITNVAQSPGYCGQAINGVNPAGGGAISNWYGTYCATKPCMISESGAAFHMNDTGASTQLEIQTAWINDCIANASFLDTFPNLKLIMQFEYEKVETANLGTQDLRDYRITNDTEVLAVFRSALAQPEIATRFSWANYRAAPTSISSPGAPAATNSAGQTIVEAITETTRARPTTFPKLFGTTSDGSQRAEMIELGVLVVSGLLGAWAVMRMM